MFLKVALPRAIYPGVVKGTYHLFFPFELSVVAGTSHTSDSDTLLEPQFWRISYICVGMQVLLQRAYIPIHVILISPRCCILDAFLASSYFR